MLAASGQVLTSQFTRVQQKQILAAPVGAGADLSHMPTSG
jgi:hypothetical protein